VTQAGDYSFFAGWRGDCYFFDTQGALNSLQFTGADFFASADVCSIVLEIPNSALGPTAVGLWHRTLYDADGNWIQADRGALPSHSIFLTGEHKADYLASEPADDARFIPVYAHSLEHIGGYSPAEATRVARTLLPDILRYDPNRPASFPYNGRALTDDVMDVFVSIISNGRITTDNVGPHHDLFATFPYLGRPHQTHSI
jgi:hypothetical protein